MQAEPLRETVVHVKIASEAPYAKNIIEDALRELSQTLDFTGMYEGEIEVTSPSGEHLYGWSFPTPEEETTP